MGCSNCKEVYRITLGLKFRHEGQVPLFLERMTTTSPEAVAYVVVFAEPESVVQNQSAMTACDDVAPAVSAVAAHIAGLGALVGHPFPLRDILRRELERRAAAVAERRPTLELRAGTEWRALHGVFTGVCVPGRYFPGACLCRRWCVPFLWFGPRTL